jgi:hypothetical protein
MDQVVKAQREYTSEAIMVHREATFIRNEKNYSHVAHYMANGLSGSNTFFGAQPKSRLIN